MYRSAVSHGIVALLPSAGRPVERSSIVRKSLYSFFKEHKREQSLYVLEIQKGQNGRLFEKNYSTFLEERRIPRTLASERRTALRSIRLEDAISS